MMGSMDWEGAVLAHFKTVMAFIDMTVRVGRIIRPQLKNKYIVF
jgi:hypothetical protein